jgi:Putative Flp pilus-assembly TadE/G-like
MTRGTKDRGQVLVLFAGGLILLMAIGALVVDLGLAFMTRRMEQNIADPGAIAAARLIPDANAGLATVSDMRMAACAIARQNGLFRNSTDNSGCTPANDPEGSTLTVFFPPSPNAGTYAGRPGFVEVVISRRNGTMLGRVLGINSIPVSSSAVAAFDTGDSNNNSLIALDRRGCGGANSAGKVTGTGTKVKIQASIDPATGLPFVGGYVHVNSLCGNLANVNNSCGSGSGEGGQSALSISSNGAQLTAPRVYVSGTCTTTSPPFGSPLVEGAVQIGDPLIDLPPPRIADQQPGRCGPTGPPLTSTGPNSTGCNFPTGTTILDPGVYYGGWTISNNSSLQLRPGIYIIAGGGIKLSGTNGSLESVSGDPTVDARVMIFSTDNPASTCGSQNNSQAQGVLSFSANSTFHAKALDSGPYKGILLWQDGKGCHPDAAVSLGGNGDVIIAGTIYAPGASVTLNGGASGIGEASVQIISNQWELAGGATLTMPYDPRELYQFPMKGLVR